ncbi:MAG: PTS mannitol transporter subunit IICBA [Enterococcus sp.]|nr:PTS mannitol transporter subunit IICBA [Enterococcus sp.]MBP9521001.1 PTS mannitol transporter subunit IICBA [Enterococcus sp.]MBP9638483.1 PTS mannitol transporter subunit IICBA [Enterococcus sp.]
METNVIGKGSFKARIQKLGSMLSSMIMPNIGALIAWGVLTALFIPDGYLPNAKLAEMVGPMLTYLIPILIGFTGGKVIAGERGAVVGAIATMGVIVGTGVPMMLGAMIMGPFAGYCMKKFDQVFQHRIRAGFEMLVNNFSAGLIGFGLAILGFLVIGPIVDSLTTAMAAGVDWILNAHLIPLANVFIEPAKVLFLNNAINHGILTPLGTEQSLQTGRSILFLLEANPGPGLGILLAFTLFGRGAAKASAPGAIIIHFIGGIHEIYFPYVMMKPMLFLAAIAGGVTGTFTMQALGAGLKAPASPGSIVAIMAMAPQGGHIAVLIGVLVATVTSFAVASVILKADRSVIEDDFEKSVEATKQSKSEAKGLKTEGGLGNVTGIQKIVFACDAGMGSSAMGASILRKKVKAANLTQSVTNSAINNLRDDASTLIVTQIELQERAKQKAPNATFVAVENFLNSPRYDEIIQKLSGEKVEEVVVAEKLIEATSTKSLAPVATIVLVHDDRVGSATMGVELFKEILAKNSIYLPVKKININEVHDEQGTLFVFQKSLKMSFLAKAPNAQYLALDSLIQTKKYEELAEQLK